MCIRDREYAINGGMAWIGVDTIDNASLDNLSSWKTFNGTINSSAANIIIRLRALGTTERIMVDNFVWTDNGPVMGPCSLQIVSVIESACIPTQNDTFPNGYFLYDVEVAYSGGIPTTGSLILNGGEGLSLIHI